MLQFSAHIDDKQFTINFFYYVVDDDTRVLFFSIPFLFPVCSFPLSTTQQQRKKCKKFIT